MMRKRVGVALGIWRQRMGLVLSVILLISFGCGKPTGDISGKVTYQGKPVSGGSIIFFDAENLQVGSGALGLDGEYSVFKVPAGPMKIAVSAPTALPRRRQKDSRSSSLATEKAPEGANPKAPKWNGGGAAPGARSRVDVVIPAKYTRPDQSGVTYTVQPGQQEHNIDLE
jgi:hypothetical protein